MRTAVVMIYVGDLCQVACCTHAFASTSLASPLRLMRNVERERFTPESTLDNRLSGSHFSQTSQTS